MTEVVRLVLNTLLSRRFRGLVEYNISISKANTRQTYKARKLPFTTVGKASEQITSLATAVKIQTYSYIARRWKTARELSLRHGNKSNPLAVSKTNHRKQSAF